MDSTDKDIKEQYYIEQMAVIGKMHNMQWLKSNSQLSGHTKVYPDGKELISSPLKAKLSEGTKECTIIVSSSNASNSPELKNNDHITKENINNSNIVTTNNTLQSTLQVVQPSEKSNMETIWSKDVNVTSTLFPNSQSLVVQRLDEQEMVNKNLQENIVTVQLEQLSFKEEEKSKSEESCNESHNEWGTIRRNIPDSTKSVPDVGNQINSKQCHDNNNNNAKSKTQSTSELKKGMQKTTTKINTKKCNDQKTRKQAGSSLKESCTISKQGSKDQVDSLNSCSNDKTSTSGVDSRKTSVSPALKFHDKCSKVNGCNRQLITGKGTPVKEQQFYKQQFSTLNDSANRNKSSMDGLDEKSKLQKKNTEADETKKCHKVQVIRTQSYNVQYNRNKPLVKPQQRYLRNAAKPEEENSVNRTSGFDNGIGVPNTTENVTKKKYENQQSAISKQTSDTQLTQSTSGKNSKNFNVLECSTSERTLGKTSGSVSCRKNYQSLSNTKTTVDRNVKEDQGCVQKFKKDSYVYRRTSGTVQSSIKETNGKEKPDDYKKSVTENNSTKDYKVSQAEGSKITAFSHKATNGASNTNKTDTSDSAIVNNVQSVKSLNSCSSNKDSATINTSVLTSQESQILQNSCNGTEVQFTKTEQEHTNNYNSNKTNTSNSETKSVKFSDNIQEINTMMDSTPSSYKDNIVQPHGITTNTFYSDSQLTPNIGNAQETENHHSVQNKSYFDNNNTHYTNTSTAVQNSERDLYLLDIAYQKPEQPSHVPPENVSPHNNCNSVIPMSSGLPYQSISGMYLNQYNNANNVSRKPADSTIVSQNVLVPNSTSYTMEHQNIMQGESSNTLMHNPQTSILPPPGFHNHPIAAQHNQWNLPLPDMVLFGNMMNPAHSLNMQMQNSRHLCGTDFNSIQQTGYMQHPLFYVPQLCMQGWNPLVQYPAPLFQNPPYTNCSTFTNQVLPSNTMADTINCSIPTSMQNNPYKQFQQMQQFESNPNFSVPVKLDNYMGNMQGCRSNARTKDNTMVDVHGKTSQYRAPLANDYQNNCSQDGQTMVPYSYAVTMDSVARSVPSNMHMQLNQKYSPRVSATANYQRMPETCAAFQTNQNSGNRRDDLSGNDSECIPPMVSPKECMYYGVNYSKKSDVIQNSSLRSDTKPVAYMPHGNARQYVPQFHENPAYHVSPKELSPRVITGRSIRKTTEQ
ncbi:PREDICTED: probable serine/threonine-protein kinase DDB_G0282963 [Dufourea novaeangliae]|uniref:Uncharacterized protein n=1 Tax=Dufourea novaeangliae TaxID=178035 RepID=A0A154PPD5_DUFNO|nr:PREDICTED: probable serine/threonine-protein kinase DDB_G0282963 [Dufourea novaeangliae]KZC13729.1 hypothetical protein WN55_06018 [Dufourea novaeangliae]